MDVSTKKRLIGGGLALAGSALAGEWIVRGVDWLLSYAVHDGRVDWSVIRNALGLIALVVGGYFLVRPADQSASQKREQDRERLVANIETVLEDLQSFRGPHLFGDLISVYFGLNKLGIPVPGTGGVPNRETAFNQGQRFLQAVGPLVRDGHLEAARQEAPRIIQAIGARAESGLRTKRWFRG